MASQTGAVTVTLRSWLGGDTKKLAPSADETSLGLWQAVQYWCSPQQIVERRASLQIPADASKFDEELFYLYTFLILTSVEISYRDHDSYRNDLARAFIGHVDGAIAGGSAVAFHVSSEAMRRRFAEYVKLCERGIEELIERLPFAFLISNGVVRSNSPEDMDVVGMRLISMQAWVGSMLKQLVDANQQWRNQYGI
jgi:hypothetical protein